ncbi:MAG: S8 family serine peptidase, partial [Erysipelotrichaceae bacterium]|nr:S8 family serine peptidase [Erysipelotrichaceae bacterium]
MIKLSRKIILGLLSLLLSVNVLSLQTATVAAEDTIEDDPIVSVSPLTVEEVLDSTEEEKQQLIGLTGSEMVTVIVELKEPSVIEKGFKPGSADARIYAGTLRSSQTKTFSDIKNMSLMLAEEEVRQGHAENSLITEVQSSAIKSSYVNVMNGFAVTVPYGMLPMIKIMPGVKNAFVSRTYSVPETDFDTDMYTSTQLISSDIMNAAGYSGEGTVVGVLDTGIDITHEAFAVAPDSPKITAQITNDALIATGNTYVSEKIPFAFDYANDNAPGDNDVFPYRSNHGNHVAGTVAGYALEDNGEDTVVKFSGVAPQAQLAIFKVFADDRDGASDAWILKALEDVVIVQPDVINMSLGSPAGFSSDIYTGEETMEDGYTSVYQNGTVLSISAGNEYYYSFGTPGGIGYPTTDNPDTGIVGSPSSYGVSTSVASIENLNIITDYFVVDENIIMYSDTATSDDQLFFNALNGKTPIDFVLVPGYGAPEDYEGLDVTGKIAVVSRGSLSFIDKQLTAAEKGAIAIIIYNNVSGTISMQIQEDSIPAIAITLDDAQYLLHSETLQVSEVGQGHSFDNPQALEMSDFSSWGVTPDLKLKPEVTAPGGHIYSAVPGNA